MNVGKIGAGIVLASLGGYVAGIPYGMGLVFLGAIVVLSGATIIGWEEFQSKR